VINTKHSNLLCFRQPPSQVCLCSSEMFPWSSYQSSAATWRTFL